jgi:GxxExxY protein
MINYYDKNKFYKSDITAKIIRCALNVHNNLGNGFQEVIYQRALKIEFNKANLIYEREKETIILYNNEFKIGTRRVDFIVDEDIMVELKAISKLENIHYTQVLNYIEAYKVKIGLIINFGGSRLEFRRFAKY